MLLFKTGKIQSTTVKENKQTKTNHSNPTSTQPFGQNWK